MVKDRNDFKVCMTMNGIIYKVVQHLVRSNVLCEVLGKYKKKKRQDLDGTIIVTYFSIVHDNELVLKSLS